MRATVFVCELAPPRTRRGAIRWQDVGDVCMQRVVVHGCRSIKKRVHTHIHTHAGVDSPCMHMRARTHTHTHSEPSVPHKLGVVGHSDHRQHHRERNVGVPDLPVTRSQGDRAQQLTDQPTSQRMMCESQLVGALQA